MATYLNREVTVEQVVNQGEPARVKIRQANGSVEIVDQDALVLNEQEQKQYLDEKKRELDAMKHKFDEQNKAQKAAQKADKQA